MEKANTALKKGTRRAWGGEEESSSGSSSAAHRAHVLDHTTERALAGTFLHGANDLRATRSDGGRFIYRPLPTATSFSLRLRNDSVQSSTRFLAPRLGRAHQTPAITTTLNRQPSLPLLLLPHRNSSRAQSVRIRASPHAAHRAAVSPPAGLRASGKARR